MHAVTMIVGWLAHLAVSTIVLSLVVYVACLVAFEPPSAGPVLLSSLVTRSIDRLPLLIGALGSTSIPPSVAYGVSFISCVVLAVLLVRWVGLKVGVAVYVTLVAIILQFALFFLGVK